MRFLDAKPVPTEPVIGRIRATRRLENALAFVAARFSAMRFSAMIGGQHGHPDDPVLASDARLARGHRRGFMARSFQNSYAVVP
jgi:hypothetical protein